MILCAMIICLVAQAQYNTSKTNMCFPVRHMPWNYIPEQERQYCISCGFSRQVQPYFSPEEIPSLIDLEGWDLINNPSEAALNITIDAFDFIIEGIHEDEYTNIVNDHGEKIAVKYYMPHIDYSIVINYSIESNDGYNQKVTNIDPFTERPPMATFKIDQSFDNPMECHKYVMRNKEVFLEKIVRTEIMVVVEKIRDELKRRYVYYPTTDNIKISLFFSKKSDYYVKHQSAKTEIKKIIESMPLEGPLTETIKKIQPWIEHFKQLSESLSESDKKQKQAKADMIANLAMIYYALEIFDVSRDYANILINQYGETTLGRKILRAISEVETNLTKHHLSSRHF